MKSLREYIDLISEGGWNINDPDAGAKQQALNQRVQAQQGGQAASPSTDEEDIGNGFVKIQTQIGGRSVPAIKDTESGSIITRNFDPATGGAIIRSPARYIVDGKPTMKLGPDSQAAADQAFGK
jgi:hypothetical protein